MRPVVVEVLFELAECCCRVPLIDKEDAVEEFVADGADEAFGDGVGPWCSYRRLDDLNIGGGEDRVEGGGELGVAITDQEPELLAGFVEVHRQVAGQLGQPRSGRVSGDPEDVHAAGGVLDDEEGVEPAHGRWCRGETDRRPGPCAWSRRNSVHVGAAGRGIDAGAVQDLPDGRGADLAAEASEVAVNPSVSPGGVLGGRPEASARRPAEMAGRPDGVGWLVQRRETSRRCQRKMVAG